MSATSSPSMGKSAQSPQHEKAIFATLDEVLNLCRRGDRPCDCAIVLGRLGRLLGERFRDEERFADRGFAADNGPLARTHRSILDYVTRLGRCLEHWDATQANLHLRFLDHLLTTYLGERRFSPQRAAYPGRPARDDRLAG
jgi:hypothetical protein